MVIIVWYLFSFDSLSAQFGRILCCVLWGDCVTGKDMHTNEEQQSTIPVTPDRSARPNVSLEAAASAVPGVTPGSPAAAFAIDLNSAPNTPQKLESPLTNGSIGTDSTGSGCELGLSSGSGAVDISLSSPPPKVPASTSNLPRTDNAGPPTFDVNSLSALSAADAVAGGPAPVAMHNSNAVPAQADCSMPPAPMTPRSMLQESIADSMSDAIGSSINSGSGSGVGQTASIQSAQPAVRAALGIGSNAKPDAAARAPTIATGTDRPAAGGTPTSATGISSPSSRRGSHTSGPTGPPSSGGRGGPAGGVRNNSSSSSAGGYREQQANAQLQQLVDAFMAAGTDDVASGSATVAGSRTERGLALGAVAVPVFIPDDFTTKPSQNCVWFSCGGGGGCCDFVVVMVAMLALFTGCKRWPGREASSKL